MNNLLTCLGITTNNNSEYKSIILNSKNCWFAVAERVNGDPEKWQDWYSKLNSPSTILNNVARLLSIQFSDSMKVNGLGSEKQQYSNEYICK